MLEGQAASGVRPFPAWLVAAYDRCPEPLRRFLPPRDLIERVRWIILTTWLGIMLGTTALTIVGDRPDHSKALGIVGIATIASTWVVRYRGRRTPVTLDIADGLALALISLGIGSTESVRLITFYVFGRGLYGPNEANRIFLVVGLAISSHVVSDALSDRFGLHQHEIVLLIGVPLAAMLASGLGHVIGTYEHHNRQLHAAETRYRQLIEQVPAVTYVQQLSVAPRQPGSFKYISPQVETILGYSPEEWATSYLIHGDLLHPDDRDRVVAEVLRTDATGEAYRVEYRRRARDGRYVWIRDEAVLVPDDDGDGLVWQGLLFDISDLKEAERRIRFQAHHDILTGLPNRSQFLESLAQALERATPGSGSVAVLFLDLDNFKDVNDSFGHEAGDRLLNAVAERLAQQSGPEEMAARLGGDEFTVLVAATATSDTSVFAAAAAERFLAPFRAPFAIAGQEVFVRASIGVAVAMPGEVRPEEVIRQADVALYAAKRQGKGGYRIYDPAFQSDALERLRLETQLTHAIERQEFRVYYQPIVDLASGQIAGLEALIRWDHPSRGLLDPSAFIGVAEETGQIVPIGLWVLSEACRQAATLEYTAGRLAGGSALPISVNLSARQLVQPGIVSNIADILERTRFPPERLTLEVTESVSLEHSHETAETLLALRGLGVRLAIDDFGTGHSGLNVLRRRPIQSLKIDRSLVVNLPTVADDRAIVQAIVTFAGILGLQTVAEGIETMAQLDHLRHLGCTFGQGHLFSHPLPRDEIVTLLQSAPSWPPTGPSSDRGVLVPLPVPAPTRIAKLGHGAGAPNEELP